MSIAYPSLDIWRGKDWSDATDQDLANKVLAEAFGWTSLRTLMAGAVSISPATVRPNQPTCHGSSYYVAPVGVPAILDPFIGIDGQWYNRAWQRPECHCDRRSIYLPGPVGKVDFITIDGEVLDPLAYQVIDNARLVRIDGKAWPIHQDMYATPDQPNTFVVRYYQGAAPNELDAYAAGVLAREFLKVLSGGGGNCRLPKNVTNVSRQGVSYEINTSGFSNGLSGISEVDSIVSARNPHLLRTASGVYSIEDLDDGRVTQGPGMIGPTPPTPGAGARLVEVSGHPGYYQLVSA